MQISLLELLSEKEICHPSRIIDLQFYSNNSLKITVTGFPWWLGDTRTSDEGKITFHFEDIEDGSIEPNLILHDMFDEDLEKFEAIKLSDCEWARGTECEIFCSAPLTSPMEIYKIFHDFLISTNCPYKVSDYLNFGISNKIEDFVSMTKKNNFLLFTGAESAGKIIVDALEAHKHQYKILRRKDLDLSQDLIFAQFHNSYLICKKAYAVYD